MALENDVLIIYFGKKTFAIVYIYITFPGVPVKFVNNSETLYHVNVLP